MKRYRLALAGIAIILVILAIPRVLLVPRLAHELESEIGESLNASDVHVSIRAPLGWELLFGRVNGVDLTARDAVMDGLHISRMEFHGEQIRFDPRSLWREQEVVYTEASNVRGELLITEDALNELLWEEVDPDRFLRLQVSSEGVDLGGTISVWNMEWTITLRGDLEVHHGTALRYVLKTSKCKKQGSQQFCSKFLARITSLSLTLKCSPILWRLRTFSPRKGRFSSLLEGFHETRSLDHHYTGCLNVPGSLYSALDCGNPESHGGNRLRLAESTGIRRIDRGTVPRSTSRRS